MFGDALRDLFDPRMQGGQGNYGAAKKCKRGLLARLLNPFKWYADKIVLVKTGSSFQNRSASLEVIIESSRLWGTQ